MALESLQDLYVEQLQDLYSAERQILKALPKMIDQTAHSELRQGFQAHLRQTEEQVRRLEQIFQNLGDDPEGEECEGMKGLIKEGEKFMKERAAALIAAAQRVEHYEIAGYGCARTYAHALGRSRDAQLLQQTLDEEGETDKKLTRIAEQVVNPDAQQPARVGERDVTRGARRDVDVGRAPDATARGETGFGRSARDTSPDTPL
jgi:ferritin-like metal-binding protein YciE